MDENSDNDVTPGWSVSETSFQPATPDFVSSTTNTYHGAQGELPQLVQGHLSDVQLQSLAQVASSTGLHVAPSSDLQLVAGSGLPGSADLGVAGPSGLGVPGPSGLQHHQIYQTVASSYQPQSPDVEYPSSATGSAEALQFRTLPPEGAQIIRMANTDGRGLQQGFVTVLLGTQSQPFSRLAPATRSMASTLSSVVGQHPHIQLGGHSVSHSLDREHPVSQTVSHAPLLQVVSSLPQLSQVESTTNEASPLATPDPDHGVSSLELVLQKVEQEHKPDLDSYSNEPDTTQEDLKPTFDPMAHDDGFEESAGGHLGLGTSSDANGLDSTMNGAVEQQLVVHSRQRGRTTWNVLETVGQQMSVVVQSHLDGSHIDNDVTGHMDNGVSGHLDDGVAGSLDAQVGAHLLPAGLGHAATLHMEPTIGTNSLGQQQLDVNSSDLAQVLVTAGPSGLQISSADQIHAAAAELPGTSALTLDASATEYFQNGEGYREVRKSERIAHLERPPSPIVRPQYYPKEYYNTEELWCEDCQTMFLGGCPKHTLSEVYDKVVLSRAWASLPPILQIFRMGDTPELGVFAKKSIPKRTQFGPFIGEMVDAKEKLTNQNFVLQVERAGGHIAYFEGTDENKCNWMMFVRPAENWGEQNLVAYQYGIDIYFCTIKNIEARQELKVWYAAPYASRLGVHTHKLNEADIEGLGDGDDRWPCYDCNKRYRTSAQLQKHLILHETKSSANSDDERKGKRKSATGVGKGKKSTLTKEELEAMETDSNCSSNGAFPNWKKKKAMNLFHNKFNKYRRDTVKKSIKSLYKKKGKASGGQEWVCLHCDLTFDNASMLNLHTLTHAAEDIGLQEIQKRTPDSAMADLLGNGDEGIISASGDALLMYALPDPGDASLGEPGISENTENNELQCPVCKLQFASKRELVDHAAEHGKRKPPSGNPLKPHKCSKCWKAFSTAERLNKHMLCHGDERSKPMQCQVCLKRFMNNSALACHVKTHSDQKYYDCPLCKQGFDQVSALKEHVVTHAVNGLYTCPECHRSFQEYTLIRKHMRAFHSDKKFPCSQCPKVFPRHDKLKLHMLKHTSIREFMCETCGRQFKRKDKLKEHTKRMHCPGRPKPGEVPSQSSSDGNSKKFVPKVAPTDYQRFIYKCHTCLLGFKRRGMLVNHLAKRHPEISPDCVPELNLPILKTQHDYFCQYCEKVYKSTSKRKAHILKNHPGAALPTVNRNNSGEIYSSVPNSNFSSPVGSVTTVPHPCQFCHKQYASKAKLLQHQRKEHGAAAAASTAQRQRQQQPQQQVLALAKATTLVVTPLPVESQERLVEVNDPMQADLLTQAMSELTQTLEFRSTQIGELPLGRLGTTATVLQPGNQSTVELGQLAPTLIHTHFPTAQQATATSATTVIPPSTPMATMLAASMPAQEQAPVSTVTMAPSTATFLPKGWTTTTVTSFANLR